MGNSRSDHSLRESEALTSVLSEPECELCGSPKSTHTPLPCSASTGPTCPITEISEASQRPLWNDLTCSAADSHAKTSATQASAQASTANAPGYGQSMPELLASYDRDSSLWRTSQLCLDGALSEFSETWPRSGLMRSGTAYRLPPLVPLTAVTESGSLLPTPRSSDTNGAGLHGDGGMDLRTYVQLWPTPAARDWRSESCSKEYAETRNAETRGKPLSWMVNTPRTTPRSAMEYDGVTPLGNGGLNPMWVEWLMGFPLAWTALDASAMPSSRKSRKSLAEPS
jgi:hypothetical protein